MKNRCVIPNCDRMLVTTNLVCEVCLARTRAQLAELPRLYVEAEAFLEPGRSGSGASSNDQSIGVNVAALSFRQGADVLGTLWSWERLVCEEALEDDQDEPRAHRGPVATQVEGVCLFLLKHFPWLSRQLFIDDFCREVAELYGQGMVATRQLAARIHGLKCPTTFDDGELCGAWLPLVSGRKTRDGEDIQADVLDIVSCRRCQGEWTVGRLILVALNTPGRHVMLDAEAIGEYLGMTAKNVRNFADRHSITRRRNQYSLNDFVAKRTIDQAKGA